MLSAFGELSQKLSGKLGAQSCLPQLVAVQGMVFSPFPQKTDALGIPLQVTFSSLHMVTSNGMS